MVMRQFFHRWATLWSVLLGKASQKELECAIEEIERKREAQADSLLKPRSTSADKRLWKQMYVAPALRKREEDGADVAGSEAQQRASWDALKRALNGLINKVSAANIKNIAPELFRANIVRGRGLLCRALMRAQHASPAFTQVYAALVAVVNTKVPDVGELLLHRLVDQFRRAFRRNHREALLSSVRFIAHLLNQQVCSEALGLELCALLLERPTEDSVEIAVEFIRECGYALQEQSPRGFNVVFESLRNVLHEGRIELRVQYIVEELFALRKQGFPGHTGVAPELDLVEPEDQVVHDVALDMDVDVHEELNYFRPDEHFLEAEEQWKAARREILGESSDEGDGDAEDDEGEEEEDDDDDDATAAAAAAQQTVVISDQTTTELLNLKKSVYLTIMSSLDFEECAHKLLKMQLQPGQDEEVAKMIVECCSQERTYLRFYGLLAERFCRLNKSYQEIFERLFLQQYSTIHHLETNKLRNVAKLFAHLMHTDAISWVVLEFVHLNEAETTSSSRIFIKILFQEISEFMGLANLIARLREPALQRQFAGLFPRDNPRNTRFSINFFTSIGLGALTDDLREHLKTMPKPTIAAPRAPAPKAESSDESSLSSSSSSSLSSSEGSSSSSASSSAPSSPERKRPHRNF